MHLLKFRRFVITASVIGFTSVASYLSWDAAQLSNKYEDIASHLNRVVHTTSIDVAKVEISSALDGIKQNPRLSYLLTHKNKRLFWDSNNFQLWYRDLEESKDLLYAMATSGWTVAFFIAYLTFLSRTL